VAATIALSLLAARPRTRAELRAAMARRAVPADVVEETLDRFASYGYVDDEAFSRSWVESRHRSRGLARGALKQELRRKGVDDDDAAEALESLSEEQQEATARALVESRLRSLGRYDRDTKLRRLTGLLARKGYPAGLAWRVVKDAVAAEGEDDADLDLDLSDD
jgi:regulatory protein